jgi:hypothetical protein
MTGRARLNIGADSRPLAGKTEHDDIRLHRDDLAIAINLYNLPLPLPLPTALRWAGVLSFVKT